MKITKVKLLEGGAGLLVHYLEKTKGGEKTVEYKPTDKDKEKGTARPVPEVIGIFTALGKEACRLTDLPVSKEEKKKLLGNFAKFFEVTGVNYSYSDTTDGFKLITKMKRTELDGPVCYNTPLACLEVHDTKLAEGYKKNMVSNEGRQLLLDLREKAIGYIEGERDQREMFDNEEDDD